MWLQEGNDVYGDSISVVRRINTEWKKGLYHVSKVVFTVAIYIYLYVWERESKILTCQMKRKMKGRDGISLMESNREGARWAGKPREEISRVKTLGSN